MNGTQTTQTGKGKADPRVMCPECQKPARIKTFGLEGCGSWADLDCGCTTLDKKWIGSVLDIECGQGRQRLKGRAMCLTCDTHTKHVAVYHAPDFVVQCQRCERRSVIDWHAFVMLHDHHEFLTGQAITGDLQVAPGAYPTKTTPSLPGPDDTLRSSPQFDEPELPQKCPYCNHHTVLPDRQECAYVCGWPECGHTVRSPLDAPMGLADRVEALELRLKFLLQHMERELDYQREQNEQ